MENWGVNFQTLNLWSVSFKCSETRADLIKEKLDPGDTFMNSVDVLLPIYK